jgi:hypothetical protein
VIKGVGAKEFEHSAGGTGRDIAGDERVGGDATVGFCVSVRPKLTVVKRMLTQEKTKLTTRHVLRTVNLRVAFPFIVILGGEFLELDMVSVTAASLAFVDGQ